MVEYDSKNWLNVICSYRSTVVPAVFRRLWWIVLLAFAAWLAFENVPDAAAVLFRPYKPVGHTLLGLALGLLIVFHNNCSYDRYWEGRKLWGSLVNSSRNLARGAAIYVGNSVEFSRLIAAYALSLKQSLRGASDFSEIRDLVPESLFLEVSSSANPPTPIAQQMSLWIANQTREGRIDTITAQSLESQVRSLVDSQGGCERIRRTPIPFIYAVHIKQLLMLYLVTLPFALMNELGWATIPTTAVIGFGMIGIEEAGVEIEDPFGDDANDLPLEAICAVISRDTQSIAKGS
jgi:putative membrane protein